MLSWPFYRALWGEPRSDRLAASSTNSTFDLHCSIQVLSIRLAASLIVVWGVLGPGLCLMGCLTFQVNGIGCVRLMGCLPPISPLPGASLQGKQEFRQIVGDRGAPCIDLPY